VSVSVNYLAIIVAAVAAFILGAIWNGPVFGKLAAEARGGATPEGQGGRPTPGAMAIIFVALLLAAWALAVIGAYMHLTTWMLGVKVGLLAWIGFLVPAMMIGAVMATGRKLVVFGIGAGSWLVSCVVMGIIVTIWR
jgi:Protein of unknown function (DUF1761)